MNSIKKEDGSQNQKQQRRSTFTRLKRKKKSKFLVITIDNLLNSQAQPFIRTNKVQKLNLKSKRKQIKNKMWKQSFHPLPVQIITLPRFCCLPPTSFSTSQPMHVSHCSPFDKKKKKKIKWDDALLSACRGNVSLCLLSHTFFSFWVPLCCCCCFFLQQSRPLESPDPSNSISPHPVLRRTRGEEGGRTLGSVSSDCRLGEGDP